MGRGEATSTSTVTTRLPETDRPALSRYKSIEPVPAAVSANNPALKKALESSIYDYSSRGGVLLEDIEVWYELIEDASPDVFGDLDDQWQGIYEKPRAILIAELERAKALGDEIRQKKFSEFIGGETDAAKYRELFPTVVESRAAAQLEKFDQYGFEVANKPALCFGSIGHYGNGKLVFAGNDPQTDPTGEDLLMFLAASIHEGKTVSICKQFISNKS